MSKTVKLHLDILPEAQQRLWLELADVPEEFTLYGGTAVALYLGHRVSVDFDFFGSQKFKPSDLMQRLPFLKGAKIIQTEPNTLSVRVRRKGPVKVSFFATPALPRLARAEVASDIGLRIASLLDLSATKIAVILQRAELKDYQDIDAILSSGKISLPMMIAAAKALYGEGFHPESALKALTYFDDGNVTKLPSAARKRLVKAATKVNLDKLPVIKPLKDRKKK